MRKDEEDWLGTEKDCDGYRMKIENKIKGRSLCRVLGIVELVIKKEDQTRFGHEQRRT